MRHPKLFDLTARLECSRPEAVGFLTLLWDFTAEYAIQGNIGKHADGAIARACDWVGDPETFISALVCSGWIDRDPEHRLLIHDWSHHCERWVKLKADKLNLPFIEPSIEATTGDSTEASPPCDQSNPIQSNPITTGQTRASDRFDDWWKIYPKKAKKLEARKVWKSKRLNAKADDLIADVRNRMLNDGRWLEGFVPDPTTYLRGERWNDELEPPREKKDLNGKKKPNVRHTRELPTPEIEKLAQELGVPMTGTIEDVCHRIDRKRGILQ